MISFFSSNSSPFSLLSHFSLFSSRSPVPLFVLGGSTIVVRWLWLRGEIGFVGLIWWGEIGFVVVGFWYDGWVLLVVIWVWTLWWSDWWVGVVLAFWVGVMGSWARWCIWSCSMVWPWVSSAFGMGHRGFTMVEVLWVFFFFCL